MTETERQKVRNEGSGSMSESFIGVFSMGAMAGMFIAIMIELLTVFFIERIDDEPEDEPEKDKNAELLELAKKLNVKVGE